MARYFFHVRDGANFIEDAEGVELPDLGAVREEAMSAAREMLAEKLYRGEVLDGQKFVVMDGAGDVVDEIPFRSAVRLS